MDSLSSISRRIHALALLLFLLFANDLGASGSVIISEIMCNPKQGKPFEYIELHNTASGSADIGNWKITGVVSYTFPATATISPNGYIVVVNSTSSMQQAYPYLSSSAVFGPMVGHVKDSGSLTILDSSGSIVFALTYSTSNDWDFVADGYGSSLELICDTADPSLPSSWRSSSAPTSADPWSEYSGSPGKENQWIICPPPQAPTVVNLPGYQTKIIEISEVMYQPVEETTQEDVHEFVELYNPSSTATVDLSYWRMLSDSTQNSVQFSFPKGTTLAPKSYLVIAKDTKAFGQVYPGAVTNLLGGYQGELSNSDASIALLDSNGQGVIKFQYSASFPWPMGACALGADPEFLPYAVNLSNYQYKGYSLQRLSFSDSGKNPENWIAALPTPGSANPTPELFPIVVEKNVTQASQLSLPSWHLVSGVPTSLSVKISPLNNATNVKVEYYTYDPIKKSSSATDILSMNIDQNKYYFTSLPQQVDNTIVRYRILADVMGNLGTSKSNVVISPRSNDPIAWHSYFITPDISTNANVYHVFINLVDWGQLWQNLQPSQIFNNSLGPCCGYNMKWNDKVPATLVFQGAVYDTLVRYQGSAYNRIGGADITGWPSSMNPVGGPSPTKALSWEFKLPSWASVLGRTEFILNKLWQGCGFVTLPALYSLAGELGLPTVDTSAGFGRLYINGIYYRFVLDITPTTTSRVKNYLKSYESNCYLNQPREIPGNMYKATGQGCWSAPAGNANEEPLIDSCGYTAAQRYELTYSQQTNKHWQTYTPLITMIQGLKQVPVTSDMNPTARQWFDRNFDVNHMLSYLTLVNWGGAWDDFVSNHLIYQRLTDGKWTMSTYDVKTLWGQMKPCIDPSLASCSIYLGEAGAPVNNDTQKPGTKQNLKNAFIKAFRFELQQRFLELADTLFHPDHLLPKFDAAFNAFNQGDGASQFSYYNDPTTCLNNIKTWHVQRWNAIKAGFTPQPHNYSYQFCPLKANRTQVLHNTYTSPPGKPLPPIGYLSPSTSTPTLEVHWYPPKNNGYNITQYTLQKYVGSQWSNVYQGTALVYMDKDITSGAQYTYRLSAFNQVGTSPSSDIATISAIAPTPAPTSPTSTTLPIQDSESVSLTSPWMVILFIAIGMVVISRSRSSTPHSKHD